MSNALDNALDEILREHQSNIRNKRRNTTSPGNGVNKRSAPAKRASPTNRDKRTTPNKGGSSNKRNSHNSNRVRGYDENKRWEHDKFEAITNSTPKNFYIKGQARNAPTSAGYKIKITNIHTDITQKDLLYLFRNEGKVEQCELINDRNGKSTGTCFVTYKHESDAIDAVRKYDGCAANGRKISVIHVASTPVKSQIKHNKPIPAANTTRKIDRYVPPERRVSLNAGPRQAFERGGNGKTGRLESNNPRATRHKKTVAELDAEITTYFEGAQKGEMQPVGEQGAKAEDDLMEKMGMMNLDDE